MLCRYRHRDASPYARVFTRMTVCSCQNSNSLIARENKENRMGLKWKKYFLRYFCQVWKQKHFFPVQKLKKKKILPQNHSPANHSASFQDLYFMYITIFALIYFYRLQLVCAEGRERSYLQCTQMGTSLWSWYSLISPIMSRIESNDDGTSWSGQFK